MGRGTVFNLIMLAIRLVDGGLVTIDASRGHGGAGGNAGVVRRITTRLVAEITGTLLDRRAW